MTRSTISPLRRIAATVALAGVAGLGAVAVAPAALAATTTTVTDTTVPAPAPPPAPAPAPATDPLVYTANGRVLSPMPTVPIQVAGGQATLTGRAAQAYQTALANMYLREGYQIAFMQDGVLVVGPKG